MLRVLPVLLALALGIYAFIDCLTTPEDKVRSLPKLVWVFILLLFSMTGVAAIGWLVAGRPKREAATGGRGGRSMAPDDDPDFLASLDKHRPPDGPRPKDEGPDAPKTPSAAGSPSTPDPSTPDEEEMLRRWEEDMRRHEDRLRDDVEGTDPGPGPGPDQRP